MNQIATLLPLINDNLPLDTSYTDADIGEREGVLLVDTDEFARGFLTDRKILADSIRSIRKGPLARQAFFEFPNLECAAHNLAIYLTRSIPSLDGHPLLDVCLHSAFNEFAQAADLIFQYGIHDKSPKIRAFILGATQHIHEILLHKIYGQLTQEQWVMWQPLSEPLFDWICRHKFSKLLIMPDNNVPDHAKFLAQIEMVHSVFSFQDIAAAKIDWSEKKRPAVPGQASL